MRRIFYSVAASLDGYIAGPEGETDWIITDPDIDFRALYKRFDTLLVGRKTFEMMTEAGKGETPGMRTYVFSRTLRQKDLPGVTIVSENVGETVSAIRDKPGKDIWLFGGSSLFHTLVSAELVDAVEVSIVPVLLGGGVPLLATPADQVGLELTGHKVYRSGVVSLKYTIEYQTRLIYPVDAEL